MNAEFPPELVAQLGKSRLDKQFDAAILSLFTDGALSLNEVLIGLWRHDGVVRKRQTVMNKLYRMALAGQLVAVPGVKGAYRLPTEAAP